MRSRSPTSKHKRRRRTRRNRAGAFSPPLSQIAGSDGRRSILSAHRKAFTWEKVSYDVPVPGGTRRLLHDVFGYVKPGTLTALMGASGAGGFSVEHMMPLAS
jgi:ABC-type protease/lipase transport system fused ATPase/permease subunit